jgi:hypothetical protein
MDLAVLETALVRLALAAVPTLLTITIPLRPILLSATASALRPASRRPLCLPSKAP